MEISSKNPNFSSSKEIDRISSLPDDVLHNIILLSSMSIFDVVQLGVLSKKWNYIWTTMPYLEFDLNRYCAERVQVARYPEMIEKFKHFINWVFISQSATKLVRFQLICGFLFDKVTILRWIRAATKRNVQEVVLSFRLDDDEPFEVPHCLVTCESLRVLKLQGILKLPNHWEFRQLKLLHLECVSLSDEHLTSSLFSKCPLLENLILIDCSLGTMTVLDITSTSLIRVILEYYGGNGESYSNCEVKISCPNLKFLKYNAPIAKDIIFENLFSIEAVRIFLFDPFVRTDKKIGYFVHKMIKGIHSTSALRLCRPSFLNLYGVTREKRFSPLSFYMLKSLKLEVGMNDTCVQAMIFLLNHSPNLEVLNLFSDENDDWSENWKLHDPDETIVCLESHLKLIKFTGFVAEENEIELLRFFLKNARVLEKLMIFWDENADKSEEALEVVMKFPRTSSHVSLTFHDAKPKPSDIVTFPKILKNDKTRRRI